MINHIIRILYLAGSEQYILQYKCYGKVGMENSKRLNILNDFLLAEGHHRKNTIMAFIF